MCFGRLKTKIKLIYMDVKGTLESIIHSEKLNINSSKIAFVMLAANYDNLGDIAITRAQTLFLKHNLPDDYEIVVIPHDKTFNVYRAMKKAINKDTIITLIGGGNSGTLYEFIEWPRRFILKRFYKCKIVSFPQSVYYGKLQGDLVRREAFIKLCKKCKRLTLIAREKKSYDIYKEMLGNKVNIILTPDIVFSMDNEYTSVKKEGVSLVLRKDKEKLLEQEQQEKLIELLQTKYANISYDDTCNIKVHGNGYKELSAYLETFCEKGLIITDRLHGMIFSYITNTPCIAIDNNNQKISSTYETWLEEQSLIQYVENPNEKILNEMIQRIEGQRNFQKKDLYCLYAPIVEILLETSYEKSSIN